jgi:teichuronic acid biosynthesis glycosyltransferase TuaH
MSLLLVGPLVQAFEGKRFTALRSRPNVVWVGEKTFDDLPSYLRVIDVGLTPYAQSDFNRASFPLKTLEYLAAGRGVVSTPLPSVDALGTDWISSAGDARDFAAAALSVAAIDRSPEVLAARRAVAAQHSWRSRAELMLELLGLEPHESRGR